MSLEQEKELYTPARYMAVISILDYQDEASIRDIDVHAHTEVSLEPEVESLENLGLLQKEDGKYVPSDEYRRDFREIGEFVQVDYNGKWKDILISEKDVESLAKERTEIIHWLT